eukprot:TRINITY_DN44943_c0_g1_i1.p1 TRINITY_DN44943_c0_g1~~TRINITY_DN44943_c0_g1_i1.p1  ORF type:complete len:360 (+),score=78.41 TRINITY_DN44943_c0_g1_i1:74-1153(+)
MVDASAFGTCCVKVYTEKDMQLILDSMKSEEDLCLTQDLIISDKVLDEGKSLALIGRTSVKNMKELKAEISAEHRLNERKRYEPPVDLAFVNMAAVSGSCDQIKAQLDQKDKDKRDAEASEENEEPEIEEEEPDPGEVSYKLPDREWVVPETAAGDTREGNHGYVKGGAPQRLEEASKMGPATAAGAITEKPITSYMTSEANSKGVVKVYIEDEGVIDCDKSKITVLFSMNSYHVRAHVQPSTILFLGPVECGVIDPDTSSWKLSPGKRLTISLVLSEAGKNEALQKQRWEAIQAKAKAKKEQAKDSESASSREEQAPAVPVPDNKSTEDEDPERRLIMMLAAGVFVALCAILVALGLR